MEFIVQDNPEKKRFELSLAEGVGFMDYIKNKENQLFITHTEVPASLEGRGVGKALAEFAVAYAQENELLIFPLCAFMAGYLKKQPEYHYLLAKGVHL